MKQEFWKSIPFWVVVVTNLIGILVLIVSADQVQLVQVIGQAILAVITTLGAANNPTNPTGFGANTPISVIDPQENPPL